MDQASRASFFQEKLTGLYPETKCFLNHQNDWQLLFAIILSAQATDKSVNKATEVLFVEFPDLKCYKEENRLRIAEIIRPVGLSNSKSDYLVKTANILLNEYEGKVPLDREKIRRLPGAGYKTSGVFLGEFCNFPYIPVDTHVHRVSIRYGLVPKDCTPEDCERRLEKKFKIENCIDLHRKIILLGRNICFARNPDCSSCPLEEHCRKVGLNTPKKK